MINLYEHNLETYEKIKNILHSNNKTCVIQPTGTGKSYLILKLIEDYSEQNRDIIVIEPQKYIFNQLKEKMDKYGLLGDNVKFITYSALGKMDDEKLKGYNLPAIVMVDEMHRAGAPKWNVGLLKMLDVFPTDCKYVGFSATPIRFLDGKRNMAEELFNGCIANEIGLADAILNRILPLPRYIAGLYTYDNEVNAITRKIENSRNPDEEKKQLLEEVLIMKKNLDKSNGVSAIFKKYIDGNKGKYVAFCRNINHLKLMQSCLEQWFSEAGIPCNFYEVHCKNPEKDKQFNAFMNDTGLAVCLSVAILAEGVHGIDGVILLRDTISPNLYYQQIGRAFSVDMDTVPIIFDLVANCESIMDCNLKNDLLSTIDKRDNGKINEEICVDGWQYSDTINNLNDCDIKEITKEDIESFFVLDQVIDAVNAFKEIKNRIVGNSNWGQRINVFYKNALLYKEKYGHLNIKLNDVLDNGYNIGRIYDTLKQDYKKNRLTDNEIMQLTDVGISLKDTLTLNWNRNISLAKEAIAEGICITWSNPIYKDVNFYDWFRTHKNDFSYDEMCIMKQLIKKKQTKERPVKVFDLKNNIFFVCNSMTDAANKINSDLGIENSKKNIIGVIIRQLSGDVKQPYQNRFIFKELELQKKQLDIDIKQGKIKREEIISKKDLLIKKIMDRKPPKGKLMSSAQKIIKWRETLPDDTVYGIKEILDGTGLTYKQFFQANSSKILAEILNSEKLYDRKGYYKKTS